MFQYSCCCVTRSYGFGIKNKKTKHWYLFILCFLLYVPFPLFQTLHNYTLLRGLVIKEYLRIITGYFSPVLHIKTLGGTSNRLRMSYSYHFLSIVTWHLWEALLMSTHDRCFLVFYSYHFCPSSVGLSVCPPVHMLTLSNEAICP